MHQNVLSLYPYNPSCSKYNYLPLHSVTRSCSHQTWTLFLRPDLCSRFSGLILIRSSTTMMSPIQISVNFLDMEMPPQDPSQGCESWVSLEEHEEHLDSIVGRS